jgi:hypothetical protein
MENNFSFVGWKSFLKAFRVNLKSLFFNSFMSWIIIRKLIFFVFNLRILFDFLKEILFAKLLIKNLNLSLIH